jgi:hypothetical protein
MNQEWGTYNCAVLLHSPIIIRAPLGGVFTSDSHEDVTRGIVRSYLRGIWRSHLRVVVVSSALEGSQRTVAMVWVAGSVAAVVVRYASGVHV